jgi:voltage-gated potassium channel
MAAFRLSAWLRRLYVAVSDMHWGVLFGIVLVHMGISYTILSIADEPDLQAPITYIYWYATTALTVGYGDFSPKTDIGRIAAAIFIMPGAIACFTVAIAKAIEGVGSVWRQRRMGLGNYEEVKNAVTLIGYDPDRTPRMIDEIIASSEGAAEIVLMTRKQLDNTDPRFRYVRASALTSTADLTRAGVPDAQKIVIFSWSDEETLAAALAVTALNKTGHIVCYFREAETAALLQAHCPRVEAVLSRDVELVVKAMSDPGSSQLLTALASHTDIGATLYTAHAPEPASFEAMGEKLRPFHAVLVAFARDDDPNVHFDFEGELGQGDKLFYIAIDRLPAAWA